jgi:putative membrane protein
METKVKTPEQIKQFKKIIIALSVVIPLAVAALFGVSIEGVDFSFLPPIYATINGLTAILLVLALIAIKVKKITLHKTLINICLVLSLLFLLAYVAYHMTSESTAYEGDSPIFYFTILISHIVLSIVVIPFVLFTYLFAWQGNFERHKKWTKIAFPIWLYVAATGVMVYYMIAPFY